MTELLTTLRKYADMGDRKLNVATLPLDIFESAIAALAEKRGLAWREVPVTMEFLADLFDAYCGADGHKLVVSQAANAAKQKL